MNQLTATRHPITGQVLVMPTDDLAPYLEFTQAFHAEHRPAGPTETHLVQTLADGAWRMNQVRAIQANLLAIGLDHHSGRTRAEHPQAHAALAVASGTADHTRQLAEYSKHEARLHRQFHQTLALLGELQAKRKAEANIHLEAASRSMQIHRERTTTPYNPQDDGFVFSISQIEAYLRRQNSKPPTSSPHLARAA